MHESQKYQKISKRVSIKIDTHNFSLSSRRYPNPSNHPGQLKNPLSPSIYRNFQHIIITDSRTLSIPLKRTINPKKEWGCNIIQNHENLRWNFLIFSSIQPPQMHILRWIQWVHRTTGLTVVCSPSLLPHPRLPFLMDPGKKGQTFSTKEHTCNYTCGYLSIGQRRGEETGQKEEFFCVPCVFFKGLLLFRMERHGETRPIGSSTVRGTRKYDFFAAVVDMACAVVAFLSLRFWKGPGVIICKSVWDD